MDPCEFLRATVRSLDEELLILERGLSRYEHLTSSPTEAQSSRIDDLSQRRLDVERRQRTARARLRDCEKDAT
jgi:hypothetical protein